jgi:heme/copper-type cytochrome/quinol oxidase subunit 2
MESLDSNSMSSERGHLLSVKERWRMLAIGVSLALIGQVISVIQAMKIASLVERIRSGDTGAAYELLQYQQADPLTLFAGLLGIIAVVFVCMWFYRAGQNVHLAGVKYLSYTPGWYVGWFFIPLVQLVMPFITTIELWKASSSLEEQDDTAAWKTAKLSPLVILWYVSFIVMILIVMYLMFSNIDNMRRIAFDPDAAVDYFASLNNTVYFQVPLQTISGICLILFSKKISDMQTNYMNG